MFDATWCTERGCLMRRRRRKDVIGYDCLIREKEKSLCRLKEMFVSRRM